MANLRGKVAIVTGASKGIGAAIARAYGHAGAAVVVNYATAKDGAARVVADITATDGRAIAVQADVARREDVARLFAAAKQAFGKVDIVVSNAGVFQFDPLERVTEAEFHRQFNINVLGTLLVAQEAAKHFGAEGGSIINMGSVVSKGPPATSSVYSATKGAVDTLTIALARELGPRNIRVNIIAPGGTETEGLATMGVRGSDFEKQMIQSTPLGRMGQPDDIAGVALFLASDDARWVTGQRIAASGGLA
jgi:3-oxoacyl-[acyl-carrier protein] reductase